MSDELSLEEVTKALFPGAEIEGAVTYSWTFPRLETSRALTEEESRAFQEWYSKWLARVQKDLAEDDEERPVEDEAIG